MGKRKTKNVVERVKTMTFIKEEDDDHYSDDRSRGERDYQRYKVKQEEEEAERRNRYRRDDPDPRSRHDDYQTSRRRSRSRSRSREITRMPLESRSREVHMRPRSRSRSMEKPRLMRSSSRSPENHRMFMKDRSRFGGEPGEDWRGPGRSRRLSKSPEERRIERAACQSPTPYELAMDRWNQFKAKEAKLLRYAQEKLEKYDASPEEHPLYEKEWKKYWAKKYAEVKAAGKNTETYDFSEDWIPYWAEKSRTILNEEVEERRKDLLKKFHLISDRIPIPSDFPDKASRNGASFKDDKDSGTLSSDEPEIVTVHEKMTSGRREAPSGPSISDVLARGYNHSPSPERIVESISFGSAEKIDSLPRRVDNARDSLPRRVDSAVDRGDSARDNLRMSVDSTPDSLPRRVENARDSLPRRVDNPIDSLSQQRPTPSATQSPAPAARPTSKPGTKPKLLPVLRLIGAFSENIEEFGDEIDDITTKAKSLDKSYDGASKILLEDANILGVLERVRNKLTSERNSGNIDPDMVGSLDNCLRNLNRLLDGDSPEVTTVTHQQPPSLANNRYQPASVDRQPASADRQLSMDNENLSSILSVFEKSKPPSPEKAKELKDYLKTEEDVQRFLCESMALVMLQTGRRTYTKDGLYNLVTEVMKKLEISEKENLIGEVAKKFNSSNIVQSTLRNPPAVPQKNPAMDLLSFTPEELVCLLRNFDTLSPEEKKCFQYYMNNLQMKRPNISAIELNILELYLMKTNQVRPDMGGMGGMPSSISSDEVNFRPTSFDYQHNRWGRTPRNEDDLRDHRRGGDDHRDDRRRHDNHSRRSHERRPERRRSRSRERASRKDAAKTSVKDRLGEKRPVQQGTTETPASRTEPAANTVVPKKRKTDKPASNRAEAEMAAFRAEMEKSKDLETIEHANERSDTAAGTTNLDGSVNLATKYKDETINQWLRRGEEEKPMFAELEENGVLKFTCNMCGSTHFGVKNLVSHYNGKKHLKRMTDEQWSTFDPAKECPKSGSSKQDDPTQTLSNEYNSFMDEISTSSLDKPQTNMAESTGGPSTIAEDDEIYID